ncbi:pantoate--beta-alanine ligase [Gammaproteobacteria bacterium]|jgi:pantoate--beta-alanine ligase|nr:pantoate--beta-alanine ligase [Pseudomonadota bacterium]MDB0063778.1 pantoate--beta-alanine ligase [Gammaproteobacteria bacterium]
MNIIEQTRPLRAQIRQWRRNQKSIALVPTMGHLHDGHLALVEHAKTQADHVIVSIFVNPLQFDNADDLKRYPSSIASDLQQLSSLGVGAIFKPTVDLLYPLGLELAPKIHIPLLGDEFCGAHRPGHFDGVATVVSKLFNLIEPDIAVFGRKDYQQLLIIQRLSSELNFNIQIQALDTVRTEDGLALSSRNAHLSTEERRLACMLYATLKGIAQQAEQQRLTDNLPTLLDQSITRLNQASLKVEYLDLRDATDLQAIRSETTQAIVLAAVQLGKVRLIDNILFELPAQS